MKYLILALALTGCASVVPTVVEPVVSEKTSVDIDQTLLIKCPDLQTLDAAKSYDKVDVLSFMGNLASQYYTCAAKQHSLSDIAVKAFNIQAPVAASAPAVK